MPRSAMLVGSALLLIGIFNGHAGLAALPGDPWSADFGPAPGGLGMNGVVRALAVFDNALIAGGEFTEAGGVPCSRIARLSGNSWAPLGAGPGFDVHAAITYGGLLYVGGKSPLIKSWNGATWETFGSIPGSLTAWVRTFHDHNGSLLAGVQSAPYGAYRWNGVSWQPMGSLDGAVRRFVETEGSLIALGSFNTAGEFPAEGVARWNGVDWEPFYTGPGSDFNGEVFDYALYQNKLVIGGLFYADYSDDLGDRLAVKEPNGWVPLPFEFPNSNPGGIYAMAVYNGRLFIGGTFMSYISGMSVLGPTGWESLGFPRSGLISMVFALQEFEGSLYAGGYFTQVDGKSSLYIGRYTRPITTGVPETPPGPLQVHAPYPNPFHANTLIAFVLRDAAPVNVAIFDLKGRRIRNLDLGTLNSGPHQIQWDGRDGQKTEVTSGIYFMSVQAGPVRAIRKVVLSR